MTDPNENQLPKEKVGRLWLVTYRVASVHGTATRNSWLGMPAKDKPGGHLGVEWVEGVRAGLAEAAGAQADDVTIMNLCEMETLEGLPEDGV